MPLTQQTARRPLFDDPGEDTGKFYVGILGNSRIRAVANYGKAGFEVSWQLVPVSMGGAVSKQLDLALERATKG